MSKPDPGSGSLEEILTSIRKSLAEQSTDALAEPAGDAPAAEARLAQRKDGLVGRLANATIGAPQHRGDPQDDDLSDVLETEGSKAQARAPVATKGAVPKAADAPASSEKDPLWFLTRRAEPEAGKPTQSGVEQGLTRPEVVRASMPPFFGSSAEAAKAETVPAVASGGGAAQPAAGGIRVGSRAAVGDPEIAHEVSLVAAAAETAAARPSVGSQLNGAAGVRAESPAAALPGSLQAPHALEAMVLDLLKPMLRQWLDQNMPRLVAAALKDEAERNSSAEALAKKS